MTLKVVFAGTPDFAATHLGALAASDHEVIAVISQPDRPGKRGKRPVPTPVKQQALALGLDVRQPERLRAADLADLDCDLMVVVAYGQILRAPVLAAPRLGCINVHASLLPRWRGAAPIQRAILAGDTQTGVCIMQMDAGLDTGDVLARQEIAIADDDNAGSLADKLASAGCRGLIETLDALEAGTAIATPQDADGVTYAHKIDKAEAAIDWQAPADQVTRQINAFNPDPVAFSYLGEMRVKIWAATPTAAGASAPGEILGLDKQGVTIACGTGAVRVTALQLPIGKGSVLSGHDIRNARRDVIAPGRCFHA